MSDLMDDSYLLEAALGTEGPTPLTLQRDVQHQDLKKEPE